MKLALCALHSRWGKMREVIQGNFYFLKLSYCHHCCRWNREKLLWFCHFFRVCTYLCPLWRLVPALQMWHVGHSVCLCLPQLEQSITGECLTPIDSKLGTLIGILVAQQIRRSRSFWNLLLPGALLVHKHLLFINETFSIESRLSVKFYVHYSRKMTEFPCCQDISVSLIHHFEFPSTISPTCKNHVLTLSDGTVVKLHV